MAQRKSLRFQPSRRGFELSMSLDYNRPFIFFQNEFGDPGEAGGHRPERQADGGRSS